MPLRHLKFVLETFAALDELLVNFIENESNNNAVYGYQRVEVITNIEKLVVASVVSVVFCATAILLVSAVVLVALVFVAIVVVAVVTAATVVLLFVAAVTVAVISTFVAAVAAASLRFEVVRRSRSFLFFPV